MFGARRFGIERAFAARIMKLFFNLVGAASALSKMEMEMERMESQAAHANAVRNFFHIFIINLQEKYNLRSKLFFNIVRISFVSSVSRILIINLISGVSSHRVASDEGTA